MKQLFSVILLCVSYSTAIRSQNLDSIPAVQRDSLLIAMAKEVILKYGPDYYREYKPPVIERKIWPLKGERNPEGKNAGRVYYEIVYLYDKTVELLDWDFAAEVRIWADTKTLCDVLFGCNVGIRIPDDGLRSGEEIEPIRYWDATVPKYEPNNPVPVNKEELLQRGWVQRSDGKWERTGPNVPPAEALKVIERAKEAMRKEIDNR